MSRQQHKIVFLHTRLSGYFWACLRELTSLFPVEAHVFCYPVDREEAPFQFESSDNIHLYERDHYSSRELVRQVKELNPAALYSSGWHDKGYVKVCRQMNRNIPTLLALDNQWKGTIKQRLATWIAPLTLRRTFSHAWVPGRYQYEYARHLGFPRERILHGVYSADVPLLNPYYEQYHPKKSARFPKRFLFVGRYHEVKGLPLLWQSFQRVMEKENNQDWELWCAGTGPLSNQFPKTLSIKNLGFRQPDELPEVIKDTSVFVLPSRFEPWGVVVHEFAAAGMPLVCSDEVGAGTAFLREGYNGYSFAAGSPSSLEKVLWKMIHHEKEDLLRMGERSHQLAQQITPSTWAHTLWSVIDE